MGARMLVTKTGRSPYGRWTPTSGRPPGILLLVVLLLLLAAVAVGPAAGATGMQGSEVICCGAGRSTANGDLLFFRGFAGGAR